MRIAVVGSGIAGLGTAYLLDALHDVVVFEADDRFGGHSNTIDVEDEAAGSLAIDTGFIVHNDRNYPNLTRLFDELDVPTQDTEMSFAVTDRNFGGSNRLFTYRATSLATLLADPVNVVRPAMWRMVFDIVRFYRNANAHLEATTGNTEEDDTTLAEFLVAGRYSSPFINHHLIPMGASVWSADPETFDAFPATSLFRFLANHGLLGINDRPQWRSIPGGSRVYVEAIRKRLKGELRSATPVLRVERGPNSDTNPSGAVSITFGGANPGRQQFDRVVFACHSDQALALLADPSPTETEILGAIGYQPNTATLHSDTSILSPKRRAWAAWNYTCQPPGQDGDGATLTYDLTTLQRLPGSARYLVSLNSHDQVGHPLHPRIDYAHPVFTPQAIAAQRRFDEIDGHDNTHFCGAYWGYGFHEDGFVSAIRVARKLGSDW